MQLSLVDQGPWPTKRETTHGIKGIRRVEAAVARRVIGTEEIDTKKLQFIK